jgi:hypothetical protein
MTYRPIACYKFLIDVSRKLPDLLLKTSLEILVLISIYLCHIYWCWETYIA